MFQPGQHRRFMFQPEIAEQLVKRIRSRCSRLMLIQPNAPDATYPRAGVTGLDQDGSKMTGSHRIIDELELKVSILSNLSDRLRMDFSGEIRVVRMLKQDTANRSYFP